MYFVYILLMSYFMSVGFREITISKKLSHYIFWLTCASWDGLPVNTKNRRVTAHIVVFIVSNRSFETYGIDLGID
jgi:hypothetical protein